MKKLTALICIASMLCTMALSAGATEQKMRDAKIFDALEILKELVGMENNSRELTGKDKLEIFDALEILKGLVGIGKPVKVVLPPAVWKEVPIQIHNPKSFKIVEYLPFDLKRTIMGQYYLYEDFTVNTFSFRGTIVGLKEYEHSWTDNNGRLWGPYSRSVIEVEIHKTYHGETRVDGNIVRILLNGSLTPAEDKVAYIKEGQEYVFANCWVIDEVYASYDEKYNNGYVTNSEIGKYADIIIGGLRNSLYPIVDGKVVVYKEYFAHDENAMSKTLPWNSVNEKDILNSSSSLLEYGVYIVLSISDFEEEFAKLFEKPEELPTFDWKSRFGE